MCVSLVQLDRGAEIAEEVVEQLLSLSAGTAQELSQYLLSDVRRARAKLPAGRKFEQVAVPAITELKVRQYMGHPGREWHYQGLAWINAYLSLLY